jgi:hypothetical protein
MTFLTRWWRGPQLEIPIGGPRESVYAFQVFLGMKDEKVKDLARGDRERLPERPLTASQVGR